MADINSLINPPTQDEQEYLSSNYSYPTYNDQIKNQNQEYQNNAFSHEKNSSLVKSEVNPDYEPSIKSDDSEAEGANTKSEIKNEDESLASFDKIRTHFPAARIKKIMQSDEDIGKVAQVTPVVVGRALEIFMANLVDHAIVEAKKAGVRRIAASHIRAAVENTEQFDFLVDVVSKYQSAKN